MLELIFPYYIDEDGDIETPEMALSDAHPRRYLNGMYVRTADGTKYPVSFAVPIRMQQELEDDDYPLPCYTEPGLLVVRDITLEILQQAVDYAWKRGFFDSMKPIEDL